MVRQEKLPELRKKLKMKRHKQGHTHQDVADETHIARATVSAFEAKIGQYEDNLPGPKVVVQVCMYLDLDPEDYLDL